MNGEQTNETAVTTRTPGRRLVVRNPTRVPTDNLSDPMGRQLTTQKSTVPSRPYPATPNTVRATPWPHFTFRETRLLLGCWPHFTFRENRLLFCCCFKTRRSTVNVPASHNTFELLIAFIAAVSLSPETDRRGVHFPAPCMSCAPHPPPPPPPPPFFFFLFFFSSFFLLSASFLSFKKTTKIILSFLLLVLSVCPSLSVCVSVCLSVSPPPPPPPPFSVWLFLCCWVCSFLFVFLCSSSYSSSKSSSSFFLF